MRAGLGLVAIASVVLATGCAEEECTSNSECPTGYICVSACGPPAGRMCPQGNSCVQNPLTDADAGIDGGGGASDAAPADAGGTLGVACSAVTDSLDPNAVYFVGTLDESSAGYSVVASPDLSTIALGFPAGVAWDQASLRADGRLVFADAGGGLWLFTDDQEPDTADVSTCLYPLTPAQNDQGLVTSACTGSSPGQLLLAPDDAASYWYRCGSGFTWYDESGTEVGTLGTRTPLSLGPSGAALVTGDVPESPGDLLVHDAGGVESPAAGFSQEDSLVTYRARNDGFWVAVATTGGARELWTLSVGGAGTSQGSYPALPNGISFAAPAQGVRAVALDSTGALYALAIDSRQGTAVDAIVKLTAGGAAEVVYTEADGPAVTIAGGSLITAP
ncbi:hypothetical protein [Haliangium sp.]|uniref:hypothetical protein n=1 Tax=Haliangium sp. TaxID=2663208 RepID=UPI003D11C560